MVLSFKMVPLFAAAGSLIADGLTEDKIFYATLCGCDSKRKTKKKGLKAKYFERSCGLAGIPLAFIIDSLAMLFDSLDGSLSDGKYKKPFQYTRQNFYPVLAIFHRIVKDEQPH